MAPQPWVGRLLVVAVSAFAGFFVGRIGARPFDPRAVLAGLGLGVVFMVTTALRVIDYGTNAVLIGVAFALVGAWLLTLNVPAGAGVLFAAFVIELGRNGVTGADLARRRDAEEAEREPRALSPALLARALEGEHRLPAREEDREAGAVRRVANTRVGLPGVRREGKRQRQQEPRVPGHAGRRTRRPARRNPSNACGEVTSWIRCRST